MNEHENNRQRHPLWHVACGRIRDLFAASGEKQEAFARRTGVSQSALNHWLHKRKAPRLDNIENVAQSLGVMPRCLACFDTDPVCPFCPCRPRPPDAA